ncbi:hypothetical protein E4U56_002392 [Claviceps arundinis]|uniref:Myb-like domain-containing protein n=1 Tax=Claviceps arundinis TaxID=1623583 RepID=A0A9P7MQV7_9HYPO|nr:hypothetical protein E4U56_002392 [Claviceps arundinis]
MGSQWSSDMGNPSPILHWTDDPIMPLTEASPVFQHPDGQFYSMYPWAIGNGDSHTESGSTNVSLTGEAVNLVSTEAQYNSCWDDPDLASRARQFLDISSKRPEPMADIYIDPSTSPECISSSNLSWPGSHMDPSISTSVGTSSSSIPSPDIGSLLLGMPPPGIDSSSSSMPSLSTSSYAEDGVDQSSVAATQPSSVGQSPQVQRDYLYSPSPVRSQPAIISAKDYQDQILQEDRRSGWSYKKIRAVRNFGVTESTLRGRRAVPEPHEEQPPASEKPNRRLPGNHPSPSPVPTQPAIINAKEYQDRILMEDRRNGWSYKKIRTVRNFGVTESTLRGRCRNLTKSSHERPRSPTWTEKDVQLLMIAVPRFTPTTGSRKVSWKAMAEFIQTHGDSPYTLAYATCKKKWIKLLTPANGTDTPNM